MNELAIPDLKTKINVGQITSNAANVLAAVKNMVEKYHDENYIPNEAAAKADRAELNKLEKAVADQASRIKAKYNSPLDKFNGLVSEIRQKIKEAGRVADTAVKNFEEKQKEIKRAEIEAYFSAKNFDLAPLEKIFVQRWLNKTVKIAEIKKEIDGIISKIYSDIKTLENISEYGMAAKARYLETLDLGDAMRHVETMKKNAERAAREIIEREERERQERIAANAAEERAEARTAEKRASVRSLVDEALGIEEPEPPADPEIMKHVLRLKLPKETLPGLFECMDANGISYPEILELTLPFEGEKEPLFRLREYMTKNGVSYEKIN